MKLTVTGTDQLIKKLKQNYKLDDVKHAVKKHGAKLQEKAQREAPVDTGALKRSIGFDLEDDGFTAVVSPSVEYAPYQEYGTRFMTAQPFMRPAFNEVKHAFVADMKKMLE